MIPGDRHVPETDFRCDRSTPARDALATAVAVLVGALFCAGILAVLVLLGWLGW